MVSFNCDTCGDVLTKGKIKNHAMRCRIRKLSCLDCSTDFAYPSAELDAHTSCISEADKYGHAKKKRKQQPQQKATESAPAASIKTTEPEGTEKPKIAASPQIQADESDKMIKKRLKEAKQAYVSAKKTYKKLKKELKHSES
jgi:hypothetical protein